MDVYPIFSKTVFYKAKQQSTTSIGCGSALHGGEGSYSIVNAIAHRTVVLHGVGFITALIGSPCSS